MDAAHNGVYKIPTLQEAWQCIVTNQFDHPHVKTIHDQVFNINRECRKAIYYL